MTDRAPKPWRKPVLIAGIVLIVVVYIAMPLRAGVAGIGDRRGPRIYPEFLHEQLYLLGWESGEHMATKPRLSIDPPPRPWFYGL